MTSARCEAWAMTMGSIDKDFGYLLHSRPFRDTSMICDFFLQQSGRISILYKGVRKAGKSANKARLLQPFAPLFVSFEGRNELKSGRLLEDRGASVFLQGNGLFSGLYINELLVRLLHKEESHPDLFLVYEWALKALLSESIETVLRTFEHRLLAEMGYELSLTVDINGNSILDDQWYHYDPVEGFIWASATAPSGPCAKACYLGRHLLEINLRAYEDVGVRQSAKRLSRQALAPHLGDRPLKSRDLFKTMTNVAGE